MARVGELVSQVFKALAIDEKSMRFRPADVPDDESEQSDGETLEDFERETRWSADDAPGERQSDLFLEARLSAAKLDHKLRRISEQAHSVLEEQGVRTLFLALGMLHWYESDDSDEPRRAPILLLPVNLTRKAAGGAYAVSAADDDPIVNPALAEYLRTSFGIAIPELPEVTDSYDPSSLYAGIAASIATKPQWKATNLLFERF